MKRFPTLRPLFSLALLWLAAVALVVTLQTSIRGLIDAPFLPLAIAGMLIAYVLGILNWTTHRAWAFLFCCCPPLILLEASGTWHPLWQILIHIPALEISTALALVSGQSLDLSFFRTLLDEMFHSLEIFFTAILPPGTKASSLILLQIFWDLPVFLVCAWSGWWSSRRNSILIALLPSLAVQAFLLNYSHKQDAPTLQIALFAMIFLMALHQKWSLSRSENKTRGRVRMETYATLFIFATLLVLTAGWAPVYPTPVQPTKTVKKEVDHTAETIEKEVIEHKDTSSSPAPGLPRDLQIDTPPDNHMNVIFLANTGGTPLVDEEGTRIESSAPSYYWRWITYDQYDGSGWSSSPTTHASYSADEALFEFSGEGYQIVHQTIIKASAEDDHLYWTGSLMDADQPIDTTWRVSPPGEDPLLSMDMFGTLVEAQQYSADSLVPQFNEAQLRAASQAYPTDILQKYLALPDTISQRVRDLAATLTSEPQTPYDKARAIEAYLRTYPYTLDVPAVPPGKEIADYFLFELKTGFCEYYATSMVVLARAAGLPARIVIGYASNEYDSRNAQYIVREVNAHSWVEIYFPEIGWVEFEPTASQARIEQLPPPPPDPIDPLVSTPTQKSRHGIIYKKHGYFVPPSHFFAILLTMLAMAAICLGYLRTQGLWFSYKTIGSIYQYIYRHGRKLDPVASSNITPFLFAEKLKVKLRINHSFTLPAAEELDQLTSLYLQETYSPHPVTVFEHEQAIKIWHRLFWRLLYIRIVSIFLPR